MRFTIIFVAAMLAAWAGYAAGQKSAPDLSELLSWLRAGTEFSYTLKINSFLEAAPGEKKLETYRVYTSGSSGVRYLSSMESCAFQGPEGQFRADLSKRKVNFRQYDVATKQHFLQARSSQSKAGILDSALLKGAKVKSRTTQGTVTRYELTYDSTSMFMQMLVEYDTKLHKLVRMSYGIRRALAPGAGPDGTMIQNVEMLEYSSEKPVAVQEMLSESGNLEAYLKARYRGFTITTL